MYLLQDTSTSASSASVGATANSGFIDQYFGGEFETMYPLICFLALKITITIEALI